MTTMIERVARGIWERHRQIDISARFTSWEDAKEWQRTAAAEFARAAILAMREPTEGMVNAGYGTDDAIQGHDCAAIWRLMIDAALAEEPK